MNRKTFAFLAALLTFIAGVAIAKLSLERSQPPLPPRKTELQLSNYRLSGPYQHENLSLFLIHAPDQSNPIFTPLQEAMERKIVVVHETSDVNELAIENVSASEEVFVQAGDIVKGGQQDRVLAVDLIVPAQSGTIPIAAFCVEHGRWTRRGVETLDRFDSSEDMSATKELKLATKQYTSQARVWREVEQAQEKLSAGVAGDVRSEESRSSLQLAQENEKVKQSTAAYIDKLSQVIERSNDVIGFAFAINNELNSAEVYPSNAMFKRFWPRLLKSAAIEAVAERAATPRAELVSISAVGGFLTESEKGEETLNEITTRTHMLKREAEKSLFFETRDMAHHGAWIHRSYLTQ
jgi:ARG/rhodanese/phosphatase superfamily protein